MLTSYITRPGVSLGPWDGVRTLERCITRRCLLNSPVFLCTGLGGDAAELSEGRPAPWCFPSLFLPGWRVCPRLSSLVVLCDLSLSTCAQSYPFTLLLTTPTSVSFPKPFLLRRGAAVDLSAGSHTVRSTSTRPELSPASPRMSCLATPQVRAPGQPDLPLLLRTWFKQPLQRRAADSPPGCPHARGSLVLFLGN